MPADVASWYDANPDKTSVYQGDVLNDIPLIFLPPKISKWIILRPNIKSVNTDVDVVLGGQIPKWFTAQAEGSLKDAWQHGDDEEYVAAKAKKMRAMVVTQSCDIAQRSMYQVAPVYPVTDLTEQDREHLRANNIQYMFYVPAFPPSITEESYADLSQISAAPRTYFKPDGVIARLREETRVELQAQIAEYFGRPFGFNIRDRAPQTAEYACVRCFYEHFRLQKQAATRGDRFPQCEACGDALWVRISDAVQADLKFAIAASVEEPNTATDITVVSIPDPQPE